MIDIYEPPYSEWPAVLAANLDRSPAMRSKLGSERIATIREELLTCAQRHTEEVVDLARRCAGGAHALQTRGVSSGANIVMAGHQPTVYHPGILCKVEALAQLAGESHAVAVNVVIDTDEGDGGALVWPKVAQGVLEMKRASLATQSPTGTLYADQRVVEAQRVREIFSEIETDVRESGLAEEAEQVRAVARFYEKLAGERIVAANAVVRWTVSGVRTLEVPLSALVQRTEIQAVLQDLARDVVRVAHLYNSTLDKYRQEHRIRNPANPFPNMKSVDGETELPLWRIQAGIRQPTFVGLNHSAQICDAGEYLAPRGSITTMILRGFCSDLFIHGLGGGKYDQFVGQFAEAYLGVKLPTYVVASRTRYIFPERIAELRRSIELASKVKEITSKTEQYLGQGIFSADEEVALRGLVDERSVLRASIQAATTPEAKSLAAHAINEANRKVRTLVETGSLRDVVANAAAHEAMLARWSYREFPFFLHKLPRSA